MKLHKVISGGQTGADKTALVEAKLLGLATGGTAPKMFRTELGVDSELRDLYGLKEDKSYDYAPRTRRNVMDGDVTLWFGNVGSPGYWCTSRATEDYNKLFVINPTPELIKELAEKYEIWNVAGNRESKNPKVVQLVRNAFEVVKGLL